MVLVAAAVAAAVFALALRTTWDDLPGRPGGAPGGDRPRPHAAGTGRAPRGAARSAPRSPARSPRRRSRRSSTARWRSAATSVGRARAPSSSPSTPGRPVRCSAVALGSGGTWASIGRAADARGPGRGCPACPDDGAGVTLQGRGPAGASLTARVTAVVEDRTGFRASVSAGDLALDGASHPLEWSTAVGEGLELVAVRLELDGSTGTEPGVATATASTVTVDPDGACERRGGRPDRLRSAVAGDPPPGSRAPSAEPRPSCTPSSGATELRTSLKVNLDYFSYTGADVLATVLPLPADGAGRRLAGPRGRRRGRGRGRARGDRR